MSGKSSTGLERAKGPWAGEEWRGSQWPWSESGKWDTEGREGKAADERRYVVKASCHKRWLELNAMGKLWERYKTHASKELRYLCSSCHSHWLQIAAGLLSMEVNVHFQALSPGNWRSVILEESSWVQVADTSRQSPLNWIVSGQECTDSFAMFSYVNFTCLLF